MTKVILALNAGSSSNKFSLFLDTATVLVAAQNLYRKNGFQEVGEKKAHLHLTDIFFEKHLTVPPFDNWKRIE